MYQQKGSAGSFFVKYSYENYPSGGKDQTMREFTEKIPMREEFPVVEILKSDDDLFRVFLRFIRESKELLKES